MCRSSCPDVFCKKGVLRSFAKHLCQGSFLPAHQTLAQVFSCEFCKISKNTFFHRIPLVAVSVFPRCYVAKQFFEIAYFTDIHSFKKFSKNLHWNLKLVFLFSTLFGHFKIGYRQSFITVLRISFFIIYELNAVVSIHSNVFYPSASTSKMLYVNFSGARFVAICLFCKFFTH